jgi:enterochelin esterase-like enzyme
MPETHTPQASIHDRLRTIQAEYLEVPGLRLTRQQAERLWNLDPLISEALLNARTRESQAANEGRTPPQRRP